MDIQMAASEVCASYERAQIMLDAIPLCCNFWDENFNNIDCNQETVSFFELNSKQEYVDRFSELSPQFQPDGRLSSECMQERVKQSFETGRMCFEWMYQKLNGAPIPVEITLVRVKHGDTYAVIAYTRHQRECELIAATKIREADERIQIMFDATPFCCNLWDENLNNIDCNQEAVNLFELNSKQEYLDRFFELSPQFQPDRRLSSECMRERLKQSFEMGRIRFEWMHQKLNGDPIPAEITFVRVKHKNKDVVIGYTRDLRELKAALASLNQFEKLAYTDSLTGAYNRHYFMETAEKELAISKHNLTPFSLIMFDIDKFKNINDTYGHLAGDEILKAVVKNAQSILRSCDMLARYGGEEFLVFVANADKEAALKLAWRIRDKIASSTLAFMDYRINVTVSLGVAMKSERATTLKDVIQYADKAMYMAKANGRNRVEYY